MNELAQKESRTIAEIYQQSTLKKLMDAYSEYGNNSPEFKMAQLNHQAAYAVFCVVGIKGLYYVRLCHIMSNQ